MGVELVYPGGGACLSWGVGLVYPGVGLVYPRGGASQTQYKYLFTPTY